MLLKSMRKMFSVATLLLTIALVLFLWFWAKEKLIQAIVILAIADFFTGIVKGYAKKELNSEICFKGICKKFYMFAIILTSETLEYYYNVPVFKVVVSFYIANEALSLFENCGEYIPIPDTLKDRFTQIRGGIKIENK